MCGKFLRKSVPASRRRRRAFSGRTRMDWLNRSLSLLLLCVPGAIQSREAGAVEAIFQNLPLSFEANAGQFDPQVRFLARAPGKRLFLVREGMVMVLDPSRDPNAAQAVVRIEVQGASDGA